MSELPNQSSTQTANWPWPLAVIILIYVALAVAYSIVTPIGRGADEWAHYWYAQFIAEHHRLPTSPAERETAGYKSDWPPLYHLAAAAVTGWVETEGPPTFKYRADSIRRQLIPAQGPEAIVHTEDELFPWQQEILVWHLGRFLSIAFSAGTLLVTYFISLELFTDYELRVASSGLRSATFALISTAVLAFNPRFLFTGMLFNYDSLTLLLASLFVWLAIRVAKGLHSRWGFWGLGALAGLALVTKYLTLLLPLVIALVAWLRISRHSSLVTRHWSVLRHRRFWTSIGQAAVAYVFVCGWWFVYLIINFNQIDTYGPLLGTLAPLIRGDGSDRTLEQLFAWFSGGQAPPPAHIETQTYTAGQIISSFFTTFWGNPISQPYPLNWFIAAMTIVMGLALIGLFIQLRTTNTELRISAFLFVTRHSSFVILLLFCLLPLPFMLMRLFGARDALEAVQGRHILFLAGPAFAVLLGWGLALVTRHSSLVARITFSVLVALLFSGAIGQLIFMAATYPAPAPVRTTPLPDSELATLNLQPLPGGAELVSYAIHPTPDALQVDLFWRGGDDFAPEDYRLELQLLGANGPVSGWVAYQTQARYPTRVWEPGDMVRDTGWLPLNNVAVGNYTVRWRPLGGDGPLFGWQTLDEWRVTSDERQAASDEWIVWRDGHPTAQILTFTERETAQFTIHNSQFTIQNLTGPNGNTYLTASSGPGWANFVIEPRWPAGDYRLEAGGDVMLRVAPSVRDFTPPAEMAQPIQANFAGRVTLLGYTLPSRRVEPGDGLPLTLYWRAEQWLGEDFVIFDRLLDNQKIVWGGYDRRPRENYSTLLWAPGEIITDGFAVPVAPDTPDGVYWLNVGLYRQVAGQAQSLKIINPTTGDPTAQTAVTIGPIKVGGPPPGATVPTAEPENVVNVSLGDQIELLGYDISIENQKSKTVKLTLVWQALRQPDSDYTIFLHLRNTAGETVAQRDQPPTGGGYPTSLWDAGETIKDEISVPLEPLEGVPPGNYDVVVGLYNFTSGVRLPVAGSAAGEITLQSFMLE